MFIDINFFLVLWVMVFVGGRARNISQSSTLLLEAMAILFGIFQNLSSKVWDRVHVQLCFLWRRVETCRLRS